MKELSTIVSKSKRRGISAESNNLVSTLESLPQSITKVEYTNYFRSYISALAMFFAVKVRPNVLILSVNINSERHDGLKVVRLTLWIKYKA